MRSVWEGYCSQSVLIQLKYTLTCDRPLNIPAMLGNCPPSKAITSPVIQLA